MTTTMKKGAVLFGVLRPEPKVSCVRQVLSHTPNHISFGHATDGATHSILIRKQSLGILPVFVK